MSAFAPVDYYFWKGNFCPLRVKEALARSQWVDTWRQLCLLYGSNKPMVFFVSPTTILCVPLAFFLFIPS